MADTFPVKSASPTGSTGSGFSDPRGEHPRPSYHFKPTLNKEVTGESKTNISMGGGDPAIDLDAFGGVGDEIPTQYGAVQVQETKSGHKIVMDDTPGGERVVVGHRTGSGLELRSDGSINIRSKNNMAIVIDASGAIIIEGDLRVSSKNLSIDATGDLDLNVSGDFNLKVAGDKKETIYGSHRKEISGNKGEIIKGNNSKTILGAETNTILGNQNNIVKGNSGNTIQGSATWSVKGVFKMSSAAEFTTAAPSMNMSAADISILASGGTIGGGNVIMYNYNMYTQQSVYATTMDATTFHGDLNGTAKQANATSSQNYGEAVTSGSAYSYTSASLDSKATYMPDAALMKQILSYSNKGIAQVQIDDGDYIKNKIDRTSVMGGVANRKLSPEEVRMKLKEEAHAANNDFLAAVTKDGSVSTTFRNGTPPAVGRTYSGIGSVAFLPQGAGGTSAGSGTGKYIQGERKSFEGFKPDPKYNPQAIDPRDGPFAINAKTLVANGIPISTFLAGKGGATNLGHLGTLESRQALARQLLLQAEVIKLIRNNDDKFKDFRIIVAEGVYKPIEGETVTDTSILGLARTGRAITYEIYDDKNKSYPEITYEVAEYLAEFLLGYDKIVLHYDTLDPRKETKDVHGQITVIMPEVDPEFKIVGKKQPEFKLQSNYNGNKLSDTDLVEVDPYGIPVEPDNTEAFDGTGIIEYRLGSIRNRKVKPTLERALARAARQAKVDKVVITSGLQPGTTGRRTGSTRHDTGLAADFYLMKNGQAVTLSTVNGRQIITAFVQAAKANGIRAGGMSLGYMGDRVMHLDMLGANLGGGRFNPDVIVVWKSDSWFANALRS